MNSSNSFPEAAAPTVQCEVKNCQYHDKSGHCTAGRIIVGPAYAVSNADTACSTFKPQRG